MDTLAEHSIRRYLQSTIRLLHLDAVAKGACPGCGLHTRHSPRCDESRRTLQPSDDTLYESEPIPWGPSDSDLAERLGWVADAADAESRERAAQVAEDEDARQEAMERERREAEQEDVDGRYNVIGDDWTAEYGGPMGG